MVREFSLINDKGEKYSLMDIENYCLLTEPSGLGIAYNTEYEQLQYRFITNIRKIVQGSINGTLHFSTYDNYKSLIDFIEKAESLRILYVVPYQSGSKEFYRDVQVNLLGKSEIDPENKFINENIIFDCLSLWYETKNTIYTIESGTDQIRWDFTWDSRFVGYDTRNLNFVNEGHVPATIELEIDGDVENPVLELYVENQLYQTVTITNHITEHQILKYSSKEGNFYIKKQLANGTEQDLFDLDYIDFEEDHVVKFPVGKSCTLKISADNDISSARLIIYVFYKAV